jgi:hypothetical protein
MNRKREMLESLLAAHDLMMNGVSPEELAKSGLFTAWLQQVASALLVTNMELERQIWETVRGHKVTLHERTSLEAYGMGMRALLLGVLHNIEAEEE